MDLRTTAELAGWLYDEIHPLLSLAQKVWAAKTSLLALQHGDIIWQCHRHPADFIYTFQIEPRNVVITQFNKHNITSAVTIKLLRKSRTDSIRATTVPHGFFLYLKIEAKAHCLQTPIQVFFLCYWGIKMRQLRLKKWNNMKLIIFYHLEEEVFWRILHNDE